MKNIIISLLITAVSILILSYLLPGVAVAGIGAAILTAIVIGLVNSFVKPLLTILTIPVTIITLGLFLFVINALMIMLADAIVPGFDVANFWWALLFSILLSIVNTLLGNFAGELKN